MGSKPFSMMRADFPSLFWSRTIVLETGCRVWTGPIQSRGGRTAGGYGVCAHGLTHRVAWRLTFGPIPDGLCVCHDCDNPPCVNPLHLKLGTIAQNQAEMVAKGRAVNLLATRQAQKTHCIHGHEFDPVNTSTGRQRKCRMCARLAAEKVRRDKGVPPRNMSIKMKRCCRDTLKHYGPKQPTEGLEIGCRWGDEFLRYERIGNSELFGWMVHDRVGDFVKRESDPIATEAREKAYERILGRERER